MTALVVVLLAGCDAPSASADSIRRALLVAERVQAANDGTDAAVDGVAIRDVVVHDTQPVRSDAFEAVVTYTALRSAGAIRRDRRVFIRLSSEHPVLVGQCRPRNRERCEALRLRAAQPG